MRTRNTLDRSTAPVLRRLSKPNFAPSARRAPDRALSIRRETQTRGSSNKGQTHSEGTGKVLCEISLGRKSYSSRQGPEVATVPLPRR